MLAAFAVNGLCTFGIRILAGQGLAGRYTSTYLLLWYAAGAAILGVLAAVKRSRFSWVDLLIGGALGVCSVAGQTSMGMALAAGLPGAMVYPVALAGGLFLVVAAGVLLFGERVGPFGVAGIVLGIVSIVLISM